MTTTLEGAIHARWQGKSALNALLASTLVFTGRARQQEPPYVELTWDSSTKRAQSNLNRIDTTLIRFALYHADYHEGRAIARAIASAFHQDAFNVDSTDGDRAISMILSNDGCLQLENGAWFFGVDFDVTYLRP